MLQYGLERTAPRLPKGVDGLSFRTCAEEAGPGVARPRPNRHHFLRATSALSASGPWGSHKGFLYYVSVTGSPGRVSCPRTWGVSEGSGSLVKCPWRWFRHLTPEQVAALALCGRVVVGSASSSGARLQGGLIKEVAISLPSQAPLRPRSRVRPATITVCGKVTR